MKFVFSADQVAFAFVLGAAAPLSIACNASPDGPLDHGTAGAPSGNGGGLQGGGGATGAGGVTGSGGVQAVGGAVGKGGSVGSGGVTGTGGIAPIGNGGAPPIGSGGFAPMGNGGSVATGGMGAGGRGPGGMPGGGAGGGSATGGSAGAGGCTQDLKCMPTAPSTGDIHVDCVARVNQFRACACLPPLTQWKDGEACATQDATYDAQHQADGAHAGFKANICSAGSAQDECPGWGTNTQVISGCLQQMFNEGPPPMNPCSGTCYQQHGHFINMTNTRYTSVACGFFTNTDGKIWAVQNFK
jgi:hypothetical protein